MDAASSEPPDVGVLIDAAIRLIARRGLEAFSLEALAEETAVPLASVRSWFPDEVALLRALVVRSYERVAVRTTAAVTAARDGTDALAAFVDAFVHDYVERLDEFRQVFLLPQLVGTARFGIDEEVLKKFMFPAVARPLDVIEAKLSDDRVRQDVPGGIDPRRLAFVGHITSVGLLTMIGVAEAAGSPMRHGNDDMIREAGRALAAPIAGLRHLSALNEVAVELARARTEAQLRAMVPALLQRALGVDEAIFELTGPGGVLSSALPPEAAAARRERRTVLRDEGGLAVIVTPVRAEGEIEGVLGGVWRGRDRALDQGHAYRAETFAAMLGLSLENVRLYENLQEQVEVRSRKLQEAHVRLAETEKLATLGKLVAAVVHELNTPVASALSSQSTLSKAVERLGQRVPDDPEAEKLRRIAGQSGELISVGLQRVADVVRQLKRFARLDAATTERIDLNAAIEDTLAMLRHELPNGCCFEKELGELPPVTCQASRVIQVLFQVLQSSLAALGDKGTIRVTSSVPVPGRVRIEVADDGPGMSPADVAQVFEPGFRAREGRVQGGLGLATAYQVVRDHGGEIRVDSAPGRGTRVGIELPVGGA